MDTIINIVSMFFIIYLCVYMTFLFLSVLVGAVDLYQKKMRKKYYNAISHEYFLPISILVPAYNENTTVVSTVRSLLELDYQLYEIVVIDDGSSDDTSKNLIEAYNLVKVERPIRKQLKCQEEKEIYVSYDYKVQITLIIKNNGGKADALNMGINVSEYPYFICVDADSLLDKNSLINIIKPMLEEKDVIACGGIIRLSNEVVFENGKIKKYKLPKNLVECMQVLEYDRSFLASKVLFDKFNGNMIISGAFGIFKKDIVIDIGGYKVGSIGEDMELVVKMHAYCQSNKIPYKIKYVSDAICYSQAPAALKDLKGQRRRWHIGLFQSLFEHKHIFLRLHYGAVGTLSFLYYLFYELLSPYIELIGILALLYQMNNNIYDIEVILQFVLFYMVFCALMSITAFASRVHLLDTKLSLTDVFKAVGLCMFENIFMRFFLLYVRLMALLSYKKNKHNWGKIKRKSFEMENK